MTPRPPFGRIRYRQDLDTMGPRADVEVVVGDEVVCRLPAARVAIEHDFAQQELATMTITVLADRTLAATLDVRTGPAE